MNWLKRIIKLFFCVKNCIVWTIEAKLLSLKSVGLEANELLPEGNIMILIPHADDEWIGCSQIIKSYSRQVVFVNMDMPGADSRELHECRYKELLEVASEYNIRMFDLKGDVDMKKDKLRKLIDDISPSYIGVPYYLDWHMEHIEVMDILYQCLIRGGENLFNILMYQVSVPIPVSSITNFKKMSKKELKAKWCAFSDFYGTQKIIPWVRFKINEQINGKICGLYAAEVFCIETVAKWTDEYKNRAVAKEKRDEIRDNLNNLVKIRKLLI